MSAAFACFLGLGVTACTAAPPETPSPDFEVSTPDAPATSKPGGEDSEPPRLEPIPAPTVPDRTPPVCTDACTAERARRCRLGASSGFETCERAADGCLRWKASSCGAGLTCTGAGACKSATNLAVGAACTADAQCASKTCAGCPYYGNGSCCVP